jgi:hypothetical protein
MNINEQATADKKLSNIVRIIHIVLSVTVPISIIFVALLPFLNIKYVYENNDPMLNIVRIVLYIFSLLCLILGLYLPRLTKNFKTSKSIYRELLFSHLISVSLFECMIIFSLILSFMGSSWYFNLPLIILAGLALFFTFPTDKRFGKHRGIDSP